MIQPSFGDLAQRLQLQRLGTGMRTDMKRLLREVTTGQVADPGTALRGDHARLSALDTARGRSQAHVQAAQELAGHLGLMQRTLDRVSEPLVDLSTTLLTASQTGDTVRLSQAGRATRAAFDDTVAALNTQLAGRSLFAGARTDGPALADPDTLMDALVGSLDPTATPADMVAAVDAWFAGGGGFDVGFLGTAAPEAPITLASGQQIRLDVTAEDPAFRGLLAGLALGALAQGDAPALDRATRQALAEASGLRLLAANAAVITVAETVGQAEARVEAARVAAETEGTALDVARAGLLDADPYAAAARLDELMAQLDTLYTVTARSSRLSLTEYLR